jgi:phosphatidylinositol 4-kinase
VPKESRQSTLTAELALLNYSFPAPVCIPLWCTANGKENHHEIVRISPSDAVVLNSADRVPYLIFVEVIETDGLGNRRTPFAKRGSLSTFATQNSEILLPESENIQKSFQPLTVRKSPSTSILSSSFGREGQDAGLHTASNETFDGRMRTAAIMLAQLALQEEQAIKQLNLDGNGRKPAKKKKSSPSLTDEIRSRIIKEMMALEETRVIELEKKDPLDEEEQDLTQMKLSNKTSWFRKLGPPTASSPTRSISNESRLSSSSDSALSSPNRRRQGSLPALTQLDKDDPSSAVVMETWEKKKARIQSFSTFGSHEKWNLHSVIIKSGADLRQEQLACQLIRELGKIWQETKSGCWVYPYRVLVTGHEKGIIETVRNTISIHSLKKDMYSRFGDQFTLKDYFAQEFGPVGSSKFLSAQMNFLESLAGYSIMSYVLSVKDRHNGNILLDLTSGHLVHIDFGFMLSNSPGSVGFESAPFKFSQEYVDLLDGYGSSRFKEWRQRMINGFLALRRNHERIVGLVEIMERNSPLDCFSYSSLQGIATSTPTSKPGNSVAPIPSTNGTGSPLQTQAGDSSTTIPASSLSSNTLLPVASALRDRLLLSLTDSQVAEYVDKLISSSMGNVFTRLYDGFQYYTQGVMT